VNGIDTVAATDPERLHQAGPSIKRHRKRLLSRDIVLVKDQPIFDGSPLTTLQHTYMLLQCKIQRGIRDLAFDDMVKDFSRALSKRNTFPKCIGCALASTTV
jgi:hypothetical protein